MYESAYEYWDHYGPRIMKNHPGGYVVIFKMSGFDDRFRTYRTLKSLRKDFSSYHPEFKAKRQDLVISLDDEMWKHAPKREARAVFSTRDFRWRAA